MEYNNIMTTREHYNKIMALIEESEFSETYYSVLESEDIDTIKTFIESLYDELMKEMDEVRGDKDFYDGNKDETISEYIQMKDEAISTNSIEEAKAFATAIYDALVVEKIRTYAYKVYLEGGINHYVQLASDIKDCYRIH